MIEESKPSLENVTVGSELIEMLGDLSDEDLQAAFLADFRVLVEKYSAIFSADDYSCYASLCRDRGKPSQRWVGIDFTEADLEARVHHRA